MKQNIPFRAVLVTMMLTLSAVVMAQTNDDDVEVVYATDSLTIDSVTWSKELDGVEVVHQKRLVKMEVDKMTYKVSEDEDAKTYTVLDMLRKVPMVTVDGQDNISVNGQGVCRRPAQRDVLVEPFDGIQVDARQCREEH